MESQKEAIKNRQMELMLAPARDRLKVYSIEELKKKASIGFDEESQTFLVESLGRTIHVHYPDFVIKEELGMWHHLTILQYMDTADGEELSGEYISLGQMPGGLSRGPGFDKDMEAMFRHDFSKADEESILAGCKKLGAQIVASNADVSAVFRFAPKFPVRMNLFVADDEFDASGKCLVDKNAHHYLTIEAAGGACSTVVNSLSALIR